MSHRTDTDTRWGQRWQRAQRASSAQARAQAQLQAARRSSPQSVEMAPISRSASAQPRDSEGSGTSLPRSQTGAPSEAGPSSQPGPSSQSNQPLQPGQLRTTGESSTPSGRAQHLPRGIAGARMPSAGREASRQPCCSGALQAQQTQTHPLECSPPRQKVATIASANSPERPQKRVPAGSAIKPPRGTQEPLEPSEVRKTQGPSDPLTPSLRTPQASARVPIRSSRSEEPKRTSEKLPHPERSSAPSKRPPRAPPASPLPQTRLLGPGAAAPSPKPPPIPAFRATQDLAAATSSSRAPSRSGFRTMQIGIETEFLLSAKEVNHPLPHRFDFFIQRLAALYNDQIFNKHTRMRASLQDPGGQGDYSQWYFVHDDSVRTMTSPWGVEMASPILKVFPGSTWRGDVECVWQYLRENYNIHTNERCSTHIHISPEPPYQYTPEDVHRIARCIIYFEPAFEALVPDHRRGNGYAKSNWLDGFHLGQENLDRSDSIKALDEAPSIIDMVELMQIPTEKYYYWNFYNLLCGDQATIEFRQPPASETAEEALGWAELAMTFIQAAMTYGTLARLEKIPSNVGGLRYFLRQVHDPRVHETGRLDRIFRVRCSQDLKEPKTVFAKIDGEGAEMWEGVLNAKAAVDQVRNRRRASTLRKPYWT